MTSDTAAISIERRFPLRNPISGLRWRHVALTTGVAVFIGLLDWFGMRIQHPGPLMLVPLAYVAAIAGMRGGAVASLPLIIYYALHLARLEPSYRYTVEDVQSLMLFTISAGGIAIIVGYSTSRRRRAAALAAKQALDQTGSRLAQSENLNRAVLNSLPAHIAVIDTEGRIVATNDAWRRFEHDNGGAGHPSASGANYVAACRSATGESAEDGAKVAAGIESVVRGESRRFTHEYPCHSPDKQRWFLLTVNPLVSEAGQPGLGAVITHLDITDRKLSEDATRQRAAELAYLARSLKRTNEELDQFAYITSHDLRAPLRGIANLSRWIEEDMGERFTPEAHQQMELLRGRVNRMEAMIDGILEYSRIGRVNIPEEPVDVAILLAEVIDLLDVPERITVEVAAGMPVVVSHRLRLQQVFMNLVGNAIKYHDKPTGRIVITCRVMGEQFEFSVADDGPGIEPAYHEKIFAIFQTLQPRDKVESTGVGLALVKKIVEGEGGAVTVESEPGRGTTFRFTWPRKVGVPH